MRIGLFCTKSGAFNAKKRIAARARQTGIAFCLLFFVAGCDTDAVQLKSPSESIAAGSALSAELRDQLEEAGWQRRVGGMCGLWVSVARQKLVGIEDGRINFVYPCSTAARGTGSRENSYKTPLGWHFIDERIGDGMPVGAVFKGREYQHEVWKPGVSTEKDLVLTRIMWLRGMEKGRNAGPGVDSHDRYIYIHGTPAEDKIGTPASHGCIRLLNRDVVELFDKTRTGTRVLITEW